MRSASDIINLWPSAEIFADDLGLKWRSHGRVMKSRGRIPEKYWPAVVEAAKKRNLKKITFSALERIHEGA